MSEWSQIKSIEMLVSRIEHSLNINNTYNEVKIFCELLNIARGRCEIKFKKRLLNDTNENSLFINSRKPLMNAVKTIKDSEYDNLLKNIYEYASFKIKKIKILIVIECPIAINNQGFLNIENDIDTNIKDIKFSIPVF